jgi:hypothetical protein
MGSFVEVALVGVVGFGITLVAFGRHVVGMWITLVVAITSPPCPQDHEGQKAEENCYDDWSGGVPHSGVYVFSSLSYVGSSRSCFTVRSSASTMRFALRSITLIFSIYESSFSFPR